jgi:hypothetical protein
MKITDLDLLTTMIGATTGLIGLTAGIVIGPIRLPSFAAAAWKALPSWAAIRAFIKRVVSVIILATFMYFVSFTIFGGWWLCAAAGYAIGVAVTVWRTEALGRPYSAFIAEGSDTPVPHS